MLPSTFNPRLFTLTLEFLPSPSTFYPRPRHLTLDTRLIDKLVLVTLIYIIIAAVGSTLFLTTDFDVMTRASFLDRVITMQLDSKYRRNLVFCQSVIARKSP